MKPKMNLNIYYIIPIIMNIVAYLIFKNTAIFIIGMIALIIVIAFKVNVKITWQMPKW